MIAKGMFSKVVVAAAVALHADPANAAVTAQTIAVTNGMKIAEEPCAVLAAVPPLPVLTGRRVLVCAADPADVSVRAADLLAAAGADVTLVLPRDCRPALSAAVQTAAREDGLAAAIGRQPEIVILGSADLAPFSRHLLEADGDERARFTADVLVARTALAVQLARGFAGRTDGVRVMVCSTRGHDAYHAMQAAAARQLVRVWQQEAGTGMLIRHLVITPEPTDAPAAALAWAAVALGPSALREFQLG